VKLTRWLSVSVTLFRTLYKIVSPMEEFDQEFLEKEEPDDDIHPAFRLTHETGNVAFHVIQSLLSAVYNQLDNTTAAILQPKNQTKPVPNNFPNVLADVHKLLCNSFGEEEPITTFIIDQILQFVDAQVFNALLQRSELYNCGQGFQIKMALSQMDSTLSKLDKKLSSHVNKELNHIKEAANLLSMDKSIMNDEEVIKTIFSHLNIFQMNHILGRFKPDEFAPEPIPVPLLMKIEETCRKTKDQKVSLPLPPSIKRVDVFATFWPQNN